jgi:hypothetical protein
MAFGSIWKFGADNSEYKKAVREMPSELDKSAQKIESRTKAMGGKISSALRAVDFTILASGLTSVLSKMDDISDAAKRLGASTEDVQRIGNAAKIVGTDMDAVARSMSRMGVQANKAAREGGTLAEAFDRVNIDPAAFAAAGLADRVRMVGKAQDEANGSAAKMADLLEVVGVRAANINFSELVSEMAKVNVVADSTVQALADANDQLDKMKQNATIFGANLLKALVIDPAQRLGDIMAGGSGRTIEEINAQEMRQSATDRLRQRGELLPDDSTTKSVQKFVGGPVAATVQETVPGPNAEENIRRINAELAVMRAELEAAKVPTAAITDELDEQASKTEERKNQQKQLKQLSLEIQEAEAAGNQALADDLREYEALVKAAIDYEGDLEMAARDVNAAHKERVRLQQEALQKSIEQVEKEVQLAEAMAFGTDEAKSRAEWMKVYESTMAKTGREDLAQRAANAATADTGGRSRGGGTSGGSREGDSSMTFNERVAEMRGNARAQRDDELAQSYEARGFFRSAVRAQNRADRRRTEAMDRGRMKDHLSAMGFNNMSEALLQYQRDVPMSERMTDQEFKDFQKQLIEQGKTPEQRAAEEEEARAKHGAKGGKSDMEKDIADILKKIEKHLPNIDEKLPQTALVYS